MATNDPIGQMRRATRPAMVLVLTDVAIAWGVFMLAAFLRFDFSLPMAAENLGLLWPRALVFAFWIMVGMLSTGMYRDRHRQQAKSKSV